MGKYIQARFVASLGVILGLPGAVIGAATETEKGRSRSDAPCRDVVGDFTKTFVVHNVDQF